MKIMKLLGIVLLAFGFTQCGSMKLEKNPPFKINSATYQNWVGGMPGSNGTNVIISYKSEVEIVFDSIYFSKQISKLELKEEKGRKILISKIIASSSGGKDLILDSDSRKELKNEIPKIEKFPFELKENEAVISYRVGDKTKYFKIENLKKGKTIVYPAARKQ